MRGKVGDELLRYDDDDCFHDSPLFQDSLSMWNEANTFIYNRAMFSL